MKDKKRFDRKELKEPDEFVHFWSRVIDAMMAHRQKVFLGIACLLVLLFLGTAMGAYFQNREEKAQDLLAGAQRLLPPDLPPDPATGMQVRTSVGPGGNQEAISALLEIVEEYGGTMSGQRSRLLLGQIYYDRGDYDAARNMYEELLEKGNVPEEMRVLAWEGMAYVREEKGEFAMAIPWYDRLTRTDVSYLKPWAWMGMARCYEQTGDHEKALDAYRRLVADYPQHERTEEARGRIGTISQRTAGQAAGSQSPIDPGSDREKPDGEKGQ
jgi:tetratricopeptide (TPR) repeat protein